MKKYLNTLLNEKGISQERVLEVNGSSSFGACTNFIPIFVIVDYISTLPIDIQNKVRNTFVKIDFHNGNVIDLLIHIAKGMAV